MYDEKLLLALVLYLNGSKILAAIPSWLQGDCLNPLSIQSAFKDGRGLPSLWPLSGKYKCSQKPHSILMSQAGTGSI